MKCYTLLKTAAILLILLSVPHVSTAKHWFVGGDLYHANARQWHDSSHENKLATAANWALMQPAIRELGKKSSTMDTVKPYAIELVACLDKVTAGEAYEEETVSALAAACMVSMGWE